VPSRLRYQNDYNGQHSVTLMLKYVPGLLIIYQPFGSGFGSGQFKPGQADARSDVCTHKHRTKGITSSEPKYIVKERRQDDFKNIVFVKGKY